MSLRMSLLRWVLRQPAFKGKSRLSTWLRQGLQPQAFDVLPGLQMELDLNEWLQLDFFAGNVLEAGTIAALQDHLQPGELFVDVGSHVGMLSLAAAQVVGSSGRVIAFDPQPYNAARLLRNFEINRFANVCMHVAAVGDSDGFVELSNQAATDKARLSLAEVGPNDQAQQFTVPVRTLDTVLADQEGEIGLLKIDVEGFELAVLDGARATLQRTRALIMEILPDQDAAVTAEILERLRNAGFLLKSIDGKQWSVGELLPENNLFAVRDRH